MIGTPGRPARIQSVLVGCFLLVAVLPIAFVSVQRYLWLTGELVRRENESDLALARAVAGGLDRFMKARIHLVRTLADDLGRWTLRDWAMIADHLELVRRRNPTFSAFLITDPEGVARVYSPAADEQGGPTAGRRYGDRSWFQGAIKSPPEPVYEVFLGRVQGGRPTLAVAAPIRAANGALLGVVSGSLDLDELRTSIRGQDPARVVRLVVVDTRGHVIVHSSREWEAEARDLSTEEVFRAAQGGPEGTIDYVSDFTRQESRGSYVRVPSTGWVVWTARGREALQPAIRSFVRDLMLTALAAVAIAAAAAIVMGRVLGRPIRVLAEATGHVAARRFDEAGRLLPRRRARIAEFGQLVDGFRGMADALRRQYADLEAMVGERTQALEGRTREAQAAAALLRAQESIRRGYGELAALLNSLDRSHILEEGTKKIAATLQAPLAAVYLTEDGPDRLRLKTYAAVDAGGLDTRLLEPTGLPAEVARRGDTVVIGAADGAEALRLRMGVGVLDVAAVVGLPLRHRERALGVLVVALLGPLTDSTRDFLEDAARQLSVALSNAGLFESVRYQSQQLERLNTELQRTTEVKSQFLASMSHELRTPLNSIIGFTELMLASTKEPLSDRQRTALEKVHASGRHLLGLINDVLDLSKIEAGRMEVRAEPFALAALVRECLAAIEPQAQRKALAMGAVGLEAAPQVVQDRAKVTQILLNLLSNAVKFTPAGRVEVRVGVDGEAVTVAVADTGPGIRTEDHAAVFESFRQLDSGLSRDAGGTGLGLAISRRLAELLGGTLTLESRPGEGSVFTLRMPVHYAARSESGRAGEEAQQMPMTPHVLVIDDDRDVMALVEGALEGEPLSVDWAASGAAGIARARAHRPAVILLDVILEGDGDGWEVLRALKADPATRDIPVVVHSVIDNPERARELGADSVLPKPSAAAALRGRIRGLLVGTRA